MLKFGFYFGILTLAVFGLPLAIAKTVDLFLGLGCGSLGALAWTIFVGIGLTRYGKKFCWFLFSAPLGLFWPLFFLRWMYGAMVGDPHWMAP